MTVKDPVEAPGESEAKIRERILKNRRKLSAEEVTQRSERVISRFLNASGFSKKLSRPLKCGIYCPFPDELDIRLLLTRIEKENWEFYFPRIADRSSKTMVFAHVDLKNISDQFSWKTGVYGNLEPHPESNPIDPSELDLIFVPGVAFGLSGERIGMGAGYYDRYLSQVPKAIRVALAFDFQVLPNLPQKPTDQPIHWLITESQEARTLPLEPVLKAFVQ